MRISKYLYGFLVIAFLLGGIGIAKATDNWQVSYKVNPDGSEIELTGESVDEIKGFMSIEEIIIAYNLDKDGLYEYLGFSSDLPTSTLVKDIKSVTGIDPAPIKDYISLQKK